MWYDEAAGIPKTRGEIVAKLEQRVLNRTDIQKSHRFLKGFYHVTVKRPNPKGRSRVERKGIPFVIQVNTASEGECCVRMKFTTGGWTKNCSTGIWVPEAIRYLR